MGVFLGTFLPISFPFSPLWLGIPAMVMILLLWWNEVPKFHYEKAEPLSLLPSKKQQRILFICFFILLSIFIRSFIGFMVSFPWKVGFMLGLIFTLGVIFGKALGGVLADRFGLEKVGITSLVISAGLLGFGAAVPILGIIGIFLFNMTMPVTLISITNTLRGREGFAFGLTTLVLIIGALPYYAGVSLANERIICTIILMSALALR
jgi:FSR family fosmidomycin resistance protein-like MFS transporter